MKNKIFLAICMSVILIFCGSSAAFAVTMLNFDSLATSYYLETALSSLYSGISFDNTSGAGFDVRGTTVGILSLEADFSGNCILNNPFTGVGNSTVASFAENVDFASVTMGDYNSDRDELFLNAYNASHGLVDSDYFDNPASSFAGRTLSVSDPTGSIAYVEFYGVGTNNNSVYWDNFSYNKYERPPSDNTGGDYVVPEPSSLLLLGFGLLGFLKRKFKK